MECVPSPGLEEQLWAAPNLNALHRAFLAFQGGGAPVFRFELDDEESDRSIIPWQLALSAYSLAFAAHRMVQQPYIDPRSVAVDAEQKAWKVLTALLPAEVLQTQQRWRPAVLRLLEHYPWRGNVRELEAALEQTMIFTSGNWITPESLKIARDNLEKRIASEPFVEKFVLEAISKDGGHRWIEIKGRLIKDGERVIAVHGFGRDITENKRMKQELKESNKQLKLLWYLMAGTRGGSTRASIMKYLGERPYNANQLAQALNLDYKTVRHHLNVLLKNGIITKGSDRYPEIYFLSKDMEGNLSDYNRELTK